MRLLSPSDGVAWKWFRYLRVFGRIRLDLACVPPSNICNAVLSFGEMRLNDVHALLVGEVNDSTFSSSMSKRSFSLRRRRSSSAISRCRFGRHNPPGKNGKAPFKQRFINGISTGGFYGLNINHHHADSHNSRTTNIVFHFSHRPISIRYSVCLAHRFVLIQHYSVAM